MTSRLMLVAMFALAAACASSDTTEPSQPAVTAVTLSPATTPLTIGQTTQLTAAVTGSWLTPTVTWSSSNPAVATVSATGLVSGLRAGTSNVSAASAGVNGVAAVTVVPGTVDRVTVCDRAQASGCASSATLLSPGTAVVVRASALNATAADISSSCAVQWSPGAPNLVTIAPSADAAKRDALLTKIDTLPTSVSILVTCNGVVGVFTVNGR